MASQQSVGETKPSPLAQSLRHCRLAFVGVAVISGLINCLFLAGPLFMMEVYDRVLPSHSLATLVSLLVIVMMVYAGQGLLDMFRNRILARIGAYVDSVVSREIFSCVVSSSLKLRRQEDNLQPMRDVDQIRGFLGGPGPGALFDLPWIPFYLFVCFSFHFWIGAAAVAGAVVLLVLTALTDVLSRRPMTTANLHFGKRAAVANASCLNAEVVRVLGMESRLAELWSNSNRTFVATQLRLSDIAAVFGALSRTVRMFLQSGVLALCAFLFIQGEVSSGMIVASGILVSRALAPVEMSIANWRNFVAARQGWTRLTKTLEASRRAKPLALPRPVSRLDVEGLAVATPGADRLIITRADFSLTSGMSLAVVGPSAAGKSSLARALVGLWAPARGSIRLDGALLQHWDPEQLAQHIGYLPQDVELFDGSIAQNIARFDPVATSESIIAAARAADVHDMILRLPGGYDTQIGQGGSVLSTGQRQRIGLARALYGDPFLVVLDEPNSNLDQQGEAALASAVRQIGARGGISVIIAHRANILDACDQVLVVVDGNARMMERKQEPGRKVLPLPDAAERNARRHQAAPDKVEASLQAVDQVIS